MHIVTLIALMLYSPSAYAGGGPIPASINLVFFLIVLVVLARKPVSKMLELRANTIKRNLFEAQDQLKKAQEQNADIEKQLKGLEQQLKDMENNAQEQIEDMRKEMESKAKRDVEAIKEGARQAMENELNHAKKQLQRETAKAAIELAEELITKNINQQDQQQLFATFTKAVEESSHV